MGFYQIAALGNHIFYNFRKKTKKVVSDYS